MGGGPWGVPGKLGVGARLEARCDRPGRARCGHRVGQV
jgi:hypothetical protein